MIFCRKKILLFTIPLVNEIDCKKVEIPPKDIIAVAIRQDEKNERLQDESKSVPLVISKNPEKIAHKTSLFMPKLDKKRIICKNTMLDVITSITTKVKQITPPISSILETDCITLSPNVM